MSNNFCRFMSNGSRVEVINDHLVWSPCCWYRDKHNIDSPNFLDVKTKINQSNDWLVGCETCKQFELMHPDDLSLRKASFIRMPNAADNECINLEISFDKRCNAACMSCGGRDSTTWRKFEKKHGIFSLFVDSDDTTDQKLEKVISTVPMEKVEYLVFQGGEPFFSDLHVKILTHLIKVNENHKKIFINYTTNGSIFPDESILALWENFGDVLVTFSIDGIGDKFEYLRWPLQWDKVKSNVTRFVNETNAILEVTYTISALNLLYWNETMEWIQNTIPVNRLHGGEIKPPNRAMGLMDPSAASEKYREHVINHYGTGHFVSDMVTHLPKSPAAEHMIAYFDKIDKFRGLYWRSVFPEAARFLEPPVV